LREKRHNKMILMSICLVLSMAILAVYLPLRDFDFIVYDDPLYVMDNPHVQAGLTGESILWAFTTTRAGFWIPLTWLSFMLDYQLYGLNPGGYHLTNLLFHLTNSLLLFLLLNTMTAKPWQSGLVAFLFALHPLRVESVAWITERKDVLSGFFFMVTLWAYFYYAKQNRLKTYLLALLAFAFGLMAKPMLVTLPFVLLLLDYWPLGRWPHARGAQDNDRAAVGSPAPLIPACPIRRLLWEKAPFFALAAVASAITFVAKQAGEALNPMQTLSFKFRVANGLVAYSNYLGKTIWPQNLAVFYPHPGSTLPSWQVAAAGLLLVVISVWALRTARHHPYVTVGWLWYLITLVPVIGVVQAGEQAMADRFTYIPLIGLFIMIIWGSSTLIGTNRFGRKALHAAAALILTALVICTGKQVQLWRNSTRLFTHALAVTSNNHVAHDILGSTLARQGRLQEATIHFSEALRIKPNSYKTHNNLGVILLQQGQLQAAMGHFLAALKIEPDFAETRNNLGVALAEQGRVVEAREHYLAAIRLRPDYAAAHNNLGSALSRQGELNQAETHFSRALEIRNNYAEAHNNLGVTLARQGKYDQAIEHFREAIRLRSDYMEARANLRFALEDAGMVKRTPPPQLEP
jgi:Flp pilus assembly protein TadD